MTLITVIAAIVIIAPVLLFALIFLISKFVTGRSKKSIQLSADITTFVLILSVHFLVLAIWDQSIFIILLVFLLLALAIFAYIYWKLKGEFDYEYILKKYWRMNFLLFTVLYFILMVYGIFTNVMASLH